MDGMNLFKNRVPLMIVNSNLAAQMLLLGEIKKNIENK
jgi:hypothetical protein